VTWQEEWAASLTAEQRSNLRSWGVEVPEPPPTSSGGGSRGGMNGARSWTPAEALFAAKLSDAAWGEGPTNVFTRRPREDPQTKALERRMGGD